MQFDVVTLFPELFEPFFETALVGRARRDGLLHAAAHDLRQWTEDRHRTVDDEPYGGGGGMVLKAEPLLRAVRALRTQGQAVGESNESPSSASEPETAETLPRAHCVLMSPQGTPLDERTVRRLADEEHLILVCGRYEGVDERFIELEVDEEVSIGDYVLSGGELAAMVVIEAVSRQIPGVVGLQDSVENDSFRQGSLDYPHYTRPAVVEGLEVPDVLLSGHHGRVAEWRQRAAREATERKRPDLLRGQGPVVGAGPEDDAPDRG